MKSLSFGGKWLVLAVLVLTWAMPASSAWAAITYYQEDFESYSTGTWLTGAPGWTSAAQDVLVTDTTSLTGLALDGDALGVNRSTGIARVYKPFTPYAGLEVYTLTFKTYVSSSGAPDTRDGYFGFWGPGGPNGALWEFENVVGGRVSLALGDFGGGLTVFTGTAATLFDQVVTGTIIIDQINNLARGRLESGTGFVDTGLIPITSHDVDSVVWIGEQTWDRKGVDVDDINVSGIIPEPGTMCLLGLGGMLLCGRSRRRS